MISVDPQTVPLCGDACFPATPRQPDIDLAPHAKVFRALGDETRLRILEQLARARSPLCACNLDGCCGLSQPTVSHHLKVLREAGLIVGERRGTWIYYRMNPETVRELPAALQRLLA